MPKEFYLVELLFTTMYIKFFLFLHNSPRLFTDWGLEKARDNPSEPKKSVITRQQLSDHLFILKI